MLHNLKTFLYHIVRNNTKVETRYTFFFSFFLISDLETTEFTKCKIVLFKHSGEDKQQLDINLSITRSCFGLVFIEIL